MFGGNKIKGIHAREILDSRSNPTVACRVTLNSGISAEAAVPSGASTGSHEALELRDGGKRYDGKGVEKAVSHVNKKIAGALIGLEVHAQRELDRIMCEMDGTPNKSRLGANAILSVSLAAAHASALARKLPLWKSLRETFVFPHDARLPTPTMNVLNGGAHAGWPMDIQECMVVPKQKTMRERIRAGVETFHALAKILKERGGTTTVGDEGGFAPKFGYVEMAFDLLIESIKRAGYKPGKDLLLATDVASSEFYDSKIKKYRMQVEGKEYTSDELLARYESWQMMYPFESIEDPFAEDDWAAWKKATPILKKKSKLVGDDFFVTNVARLKRGIEEKAATAILIKFNQIGSLSETVDAIVMAHENGFATSISHRSGETSDTTIADLAVACGSEYIKTGSLSRSERVEKYNRLMEIEEEMKI
ncbi:MAG TPA: phosphopyruvate hydratase [Patescibacteria group bacterium]|nr:phosphopyruvate hydratase [Patescibacteria group bacterium]